jgi:acyl carrier protein
MMIRDEITAYLTNVAAGRGIAASALGPDVPLMETGVLDSLSLLDFIRFVERTWNISIAEEEIVLENFGSIAAVTAYLERRQPAGVRR